MFSNNDLNQLVMRYDQLKQHGETLLTQANQTLGEIEQVKLRQRRIESQLEGLKEGENWIAKYCCSVPQDAYRLMCDRYDHTWLTGAGWMLDLREVYNNNPGHYRNILDLLNRKNPGCWKLTWMKSHALSKRQQQEAGSAELLSRAVESQTEAEVIQESESRRKQKLIAQLRTNYEYAHEWLEYNKRGGGDVTYHVTDENGRFPMLVKAAEAKLLKVYWKPDGSCGCFSIADLIHVVGQPDFAQLRDSDLISLLGQYCDDGSAELFVGAYREKAIELLVDHLAKLEDLSDEHGYLSYEELKSLVENAH